MMAIARNGLIAICLALCAVVGFEIYRMELGPPTYAPAAVISIPERSGAADIAGSADRRNAWLDQILGRPLFAPDRRPVETGVSGLPRLTGIVVTESERFAIFAGPSGDRPIVAQAGAHVGAYEVRSIGDGLVTVSGPSGTSSVRPVFDVARPPPTMSLPGRPQPGRPVAR